MAEGLSQDDSSTEFMKRKASDEEEGSNGEEELECAVCLQKCVHPVKLPCSHIFCFLCVKGVANQSKRCAMCRQEIPADFLDNPTLLSALEAEKQDTHDGGYQWFYEGRNGWWQYDERTSSELENAYKCSQRACEVLIAGFLYVIDFDNMIQLRRNDPSRRRRIKRDLSSIPKKGVAGIKLKSQLEEELRQRAATSEAQEGLTGDLCPPTPIAPSNTPQTPHTPSANSSGSSPDTTETHHLFHNNVDSPHEDISLHHHHHHHHHNHLRHHSSHHTPHYHHHQGEQPLTSSRGNNISSSTSSRLAEGQHQQNEQHQPQSDQQQLSTVSPNPSVAASIEAAIFEMGQLSLQAENDEPEYYALDASDDTEQYHLTMSSDEENI
ncbi:uncharacterized protein LOC143020371 [Oratosquilla oratoria]|uniref:uncharacterized protein LOC143020371 n=1 Tax=Oratosquilla oratoria TaxID=337810 RepID=UPI003F7667EE